MVWDDENKNEEIKNEDRLAELKRMRRLSLKPQMDYQVLLKQQLQGQKKNRH